MAISSKAELEDICHYLGADHIKGYKLRKRELANQLGDYIFRQPETWLDLMLESDLRLLQALVRSGKKGSVSVPYTESSSFFVTYNLLQRDLNSDGTVEVFLPRDMKAAISPYIDKAIEKGEQCGRFEIDKISLGFLNLYGILTAKEYVGLMREHYKATEGVIEPQDYLKFMRISRVMHMNSRNVKGKRYFTSPSLSRPDEILKRRRDFSGKSGKKARFTLEQALEAGSGAPLFTYGLNTAEGKKLDRMLRSFGFEGEDLAYEEHMIWLLSQFMDDETDIELIFHTIYSIDDTTDQFKTDEEFDAAMQTMTDYVNSLPKWILKGKSAKEVSCLLVSLDSDDEFYGRPSIEDLDGRGQAAGAYGPSSAYDDDGSLDGIGGASLKSLATSLGMFSGLVIHPSSGDAPCPCGSGLSYKNCHGKRLS